MIEADPTNRHQDAKKGRLQASGDVVTAFLNAVSNKDIHATQPYGINDGTCKVCRLNRALYDLSIAPMWWSLPLPASHPSALKCAFLLDFCMNRFISLEMIIHDLVGWLAESGGLIILSSVELERG